MRQPPAGGPGRRSRSSRPSGHPLLVRPDHERVLVRILIGRHHEIRRGGRAGEHPPGEVEARAVARTEEAARPAGIQLARAEALLGQAAEVRAGGHQHQELAVARAQRVVRVRGLDRILGVRILEQCVVTCDPGDHFLSAPHDVDRGAAPDRGGHLSRLDLAQVERGGYALGPRALRRAPGFDERNGGEHSPDRAGRDRRPGEEFAPIATGTVGAVFAAVPFIESWSPSESARAQGVPATLDLSKIEPGQMTTAVWRRSPIYVVRRTEEMIARISGHEALLKDPNSENSIQPPYAHNALRSRSSEFLVLVGTCTHLGCLPKQRFSAGELYPSWPGGFFCPCHGSRFDLAGRVFSGSPASTNLVVPPYQYPNEHTLVIGADEKGVA